MFVLDSYAWAVAFCIITMFCWGSWANTQKLAQKNWRFELFYWDYAIGVVLLSLLFGLTLGSVGSEGRSFLQDLSQASRDSLVSAFIGGVIFNAANILLVAAIAIAGMAVAFPVGPKGPEVFAVNIAHGDPDASGHVFQGPANHVQPAVVADGGVGGIVKTPALHGSHSHREVVFQEVGPCLCLARAHRRPYDSEFYATQGY